MTWDERIEEPQAARTEEGGRGRNITKEKEGQLGIVKWEGARGAGGRKKPANLSAMNLHRGRKSNIRGGGGKTKSWGENSVGERPGYSASDRASVR